MLTTGRVTWREQGECWDSRVDWWFATDNPTASMAQLVCLEICEVTNECYRYGVENKMSGIWGGVPLLKGRHTKGRNWA